MPLAGSADPAMVLHGMFRRERTEDEASPDALIQAANLAAAIEAMALTVDGRAREIENMDADGAASDAVRALQSQAFTLHKAADNLRDARGKREVGAAFNAAHAATINFSASHAAMLTGMHEAGHEDEHGATAAATAAKASYIVPMAEVQRRAAIFIQHTVKDDKQKIYAPFKKDPRYNRFQEVPTPGDVIKHFKETAQKVDEHAFTATQKRTLGTVKATAIKAQISSFNVTDANIDQAAIRAADMALGEQFGREFSNVNGQSVEDFLKEARLRTGRGFAPVPQERMTEYLHEISNLKGRGHLDEMQKADLEMYQRAVSQAQASNKYFEAQEQLRLIMTDKAARELILVQESMGHLAGLPPEAIDVHLREAEKRLQRLRGGLEVSDEDERMASSILKAKLLEPAPEIEVEVPEIPVSGDTLSEIEEAAKGIRWHMGDAAAVSMSDPLPMQMLPRKKAVVAAVGFPRFR